METEDIFLLLHHDSVYDDDVAPPRNDARESESRPVRPSTSRDARPLKPAMTMTRRPGLTSLNPQSCCWRVALFTSTQNPTFFKISRHIKSLDAYIKY